MDSVGGHNRGGSGLEYVAGDNTEEAAVLTVVLAAIMTGFRVG